MALPLSLDVLALAACPLGTLALALGTRGPALQEAPRLARSIALPEVEGRLDHMALDERRGRLFVAALAQNAALVVDLEQGRLVQSLAGVPRPQGALFLAEADRLLVTCGGDGKLAAFDGASLERTGDLDVGLDADELRFDERRGLVLVGAGGGGPGQGALVFVDPEEWRVVGRAELEGHPESFQIEPDGQRAFVNVPSRNEIAIVDLEARVRTGAWPLAEGLAANFPLGIAPDDGALLVGCRTPGKLLVVDPATGAAEVAGEISAQADGLFVTGGGARVLVTSGAGFLEVFERGPEGTFARTLSAPTAEGARTGILSSEERRLWIAVPHRGDQRAEVREYELGEPGEAGAAPADTAGGTEPRSE
jgi:hypothetical protein